MSDTATLDVQEEKMKGWLKRIDLIAETVRRTLLRTSQILRGPGETTVEREPEEFLPGYAPLLSSRIENVWRLVQRLDVDVYDIEELF